MGKYASPPAIPAELILPIVPERAVRRSDPRAHTQASIPYGSRNVMREKAMNTIAFPRGRGEVAILAAEAGRARVERDLHRRGHMQRAPMFLAAFATLMLGACYTAPTTQDVSAVSSNSVTFHRDVEPILQKRCQGCHVPGGIAPFALTSYDEAMPRAASIVAATASREMPPWGAHTTAECTPPLPYADDARLSDAELATLRAWSEAGTPRGEATTLAPSVHAKVNVLEGAESFRPSAGFVANGETDTLRCFVIDPKLTVTRFANGTFFVPSNATVVHHALAFAIPADAQAPADAYDCFGGPQVAGSTLIAAWAPGSVPATYPTGVAMPIEAGTRFVVQVHYHPHAHASPEPDTTTFQVRFTDAVPDYLVMTRLIGNFKKADGALGALLPGPNDPPKGPQFSIPADTKGHVETMRFEVPDTIKGVPIPELRVLGVGAHMHLAGVDQKITLTPKDGSGDVCLLQDSAWNFDWQRGYQFDAPIDRLPRVVPGDRIDIRCTYDNTTQNVSLARARTEARQSGTAEIELGESTLDEMCLGAFAFVTKRP